jgi:hypothetical protein
MVIGGSESYDPLAPIHQSPITIHHLREAMPPDPNSALYVEK